nr:immunoglobulin heavy chain junction region [Macaca mulatta]MPN70038.1 immunoglobulin heavy chain junction region [Macaca mulatta]MPN71050.1 immunoglobulin heavy chain junction region [Macaca mulatta]MPN72077.1 immunoglobulin heavy chain junction region [Macaca mulatta]MPN73178.1 immunoglobulin heavy chain junction region [Macaca mulatta]
CARHGSGPYFDFW